MSSTSAWHVKHTAHTEKGALEERECPDKGKHDAHGWCSHVLSKDAWCEGTGIPAYSTANFPGTPYSSFVKTDYSAAGKGDKDGKPWRADYSAPLGVSEARRIAFDMHAAQKDKNGQPYGAHLEAVRQGVVVLGGGVEEQIAALFHDSVEDYHTTYEMLKKIGLTEHTIDMVRAVTKLTGEDQSVRLAATIKAGHGACRVKLADLLHNTRWDRIEELKKTKGQATVDRVLKKYRPSIAAFMLELGMIVDEDTQKKLATKPIGTAGGTYTGTTTTATSSIQFAVNTLFPGDWPIGYPAPIVRKVEEDSTFLKGKGQVTYALANGQFMFEDMRWSSASKEIKKKPVYTFDKWSVNNKITFTDVTEDQIADYLEIIEELLAEFRQQGLGADGEPGGPILTSEIVDLVDEKDQFDKDGYWKNEDIESLDFSGWAGGL